jgi:hypothetical protein
VEVLEGSSIRATVVANVFRQDLRDAGTGTGSYGFSIAVPAALKNGQGRTLSVRIQGTTFILPGTRAITCATPAIYNGNFEIADCIKIGGWVWATNYPDSTLTVEVLEGNAVVATGIAANYRGDMSIGTRNYGFRIVLPESLKNGQVHQLTVRVKGTNYILPGSVKSVTCASSARVLSTTNSDTLEEKLELNSENLVDWELIVAPNPTKGSITINYQLMKKESATMLVYDLTGTLIWKKDVIGSGKKAMESLNLDKYPDGDYIFHIRASHKSESKRIVLTK